MVKPGYLAQIAGTRGAQAQAQQDAGRLGAVTSAIDGVTAQVRANGDKTQAVQVENTDLAKSSDIDAMIKQLKEVQLAQLMGGTQKQSIIMADSTDLGDRMGEVAALLKQLVDSNDDVETVTAVKEVVARLNVLNSSVSALSDDTMLAHAMESLEAAINGINVQPVVNVAPAEVTMPTLDLTPISDALQAYAPVADTDYDLDCYRAMDLEEEEIGVQHVGFVNPDGGWYIIQNIEQDNTLRYKFGAAGYAEAWPLAPTFEYRRLDEAIREVTT